MNQHDLIQTLVTLFNALADEVQTLSDRQTILEHKLRYAHEQVKPSSCDPTVPTLSPPASPSNDEKHLALDQERPSGPRLTDKHLPLAEPSRPPFFVFFPLTSLRPPHRD